jgi:uncharacterized membrane protein
MPRNAATCFRGIFSGKFAGESTPMNAIQKKHIQFAALMSAVTTCVVSFALVATNYGLRAGFVAVWMRSWLIAFVLVGLSIYYVAPLIRKVVDRLP